MQSSSTQQTPSDQEGRREPPELQAIIAEMNEIVAGIAEYAQLLAKEHKPQVTGSILRFVTRYKALSQQLHQELDNPGQGHPSPPEARST